MWGPAGGGRGRGCQQADGYALTLGDFFSAFCRRLYFFPCLPLPPPPPAGASAVCLRLCHTCLRATHWWCSTWCPHCSTCTQVCVWGGDLYSGERDLTAVPIHSCMWEAEVPGWSWHNSVDGPERVSACVAAFPLETLEPSPKPFTLPPNPEPAWPRVLMLADKEAD